ncbi:MAG: N-acetylneuraminate synthase family protein [Candidatus Pelagibacter sp.]
MKSSFKKFNKVFIIAEAGVNHNGSLKKAMKLVDIAAKANVDAIKFQTFLPGEISGEYSINIGYLKKNKIKRHLLSKKLALSFDDFIKLKKYCDKKKILFLSTPDGEKSLSFLVNKIKVPIIKIGSSEVTNHEFLKLIARSKLPIIFSTGMSTLQEVQKAYKILKKNSSQEIVVMHCTTEYPAPINEMNINCISTLKKKLKCTVGLSDHSQTNISSIAAISLGAKVIEKHFTINKSHSGPDHKASLSPKELNFFVKDLRNVEKCLGSYIKQPTKSEIRNIPGVRRGLVASKKLKKGTKLKSEMIAAKRPYKGLSPFDKSKIIGKKLKKNLNYDQPILLKDLK